MVASILTNLYSILINESNDEFLFNFWNVTIIDKKFAKGKTYMYIIFVEADIILNTKTIEILEMIKTCCMLQDEVKICVES